MEELGSFDWTQLPPIVAVLWMLAMRAWRAKELSPLRELYSDARKKLGESRTKIADLEDGLYEEQREHKRTKELKQDVMDQLNRTRSTHEGDSKAKASSSEDEAAEDT